MIWGEPIFNTPTGKWLVREIGRADAFVGLFDKDLSFNALYFQPHTCSRITIPDCIFFTALEEGELTMNGGRFRYFSPSPFEHKVDVHYEEPTPYLEWVLEKNCLWSVELQRSEFDIRLGCFVDYAEFSFPTSSLAVEFSLVFK